MGRIIFEAAFVFAFFAFLAAQAASGFMHTLFADGVYPRAMRAFDAVLDAALIGPFGPFGAAAILLGLGMVFGLTIVLRETPERRP